MSNNLEKIISSAKLAGLRPEEKATIRASILHTMNTTKVRSPFWNFSYIKSYHYVPAFMMLFVFLSGGTSYFAHSSLPGDTLYPMKINVNESLESFLATSDKEVAEIIAIQATRRLDEAEILATKGVLKVEQNDLIKESFSKKVVSLNNTFAKMEEKGDIESAMEVLNKFDDKVKSKINTLSSISDKKGEVSIASDIAVFIAERHGRTDKINSKTSADSRAFTAMSAKASDTESDNNAEATTMMMAVEPPEAPNATNTATSTEFTTYTDDSMLEVKSNTFKSTIRWEWRHDD